MEFGFQVAIGSAVSVLIWWVWGAAVVAWWWSRWHEWLGWMFGLSILVGLWLFFTVWSVLEREPMVVRFWIVLGLPLGLVFGLVQHGLQRVSGFRSLWDWLRLVRPNPRFRTSKHHEPPKTEGLWVPEAKPSPEFSRRRLVITCGIEIAFIVVLALACGVIKVL